MWCNKILLILNNRWEMGRIRTPFFTDPEHGYRFLPLSTPANFHWTMPVSKNRDEVNSTLAIKTSLRNFSDVHLNEGEASRKSHPPEEPVIVHPPHVQGAAHRQLAQNLIKEHTHLFITRSPGT
jgi:hypothetical protein